MEFREKVEIAAYGLICADCDISKIPSDSHVTNSMVKWFQSEGWIKLSESVSDIIKKKMYCKGCYGYRDDVHCFADCEILVFCVDEHGLENCSQCDDFPCKKFEGYEESGGKYLDAFTRLKVLSESKKGAEGAYT